VNKGKVVLDDRLDQIRSRQTSDIVSVELEGDTDFVEGLPNVLKVMSEGKRLDIKLAPDADPQELLRALMDRVRVQAFEVKVPSLHEIFVDLVGKSDAEAA
jgi:ABC-2 type transport system ATP-binding protein